jgi:hypothetical protein
VTFLQVVGLTLDEYEAIQAWDAEKFLELLSTRDPSLVTDLHRTTWLRDPAFARDVENGSRRDGSSQYVSYVAKAEWEAGANARVTLGANAVRCLLRLLPQRLSFGRSFVLSSGKQTIRIDPSDNIAWRAEGDALVICLPTGYCSRFCQGLAIRRGRYRWDDLPGLELTVLPSEIKDRAGKIVEVIG